MKETKVFFVLLAVLILLAGPVALVSAGGGGQSSSAGRPLEIRYMGDQTVGSPMYEPLAQMVEGFHKANPDVRVELDLLPSMEYRTKISVEMAAGNPPEVTNCIFSYASEFMRENRIEDWRPIMAKNPEFAQWIPMRYIQNMDYGDGRITLIPTQAQVDGFYYNTEIFNKNGWQPPKTFDELLALAPKARAAGISLMVNGGRDIRFAWLASALMAGVAGKEKADALAFGNAMDQWDNPSYGFVTAMTKFKQLVDAGAFHRGTMGFSVQEADMAFIRGEAAMYYEGEWKANDFLIRGSKEFVDIIRRIDFPAFTDCPDGDSSIRIGGNIWGVMIPTGHNERTMDAVIRFSKAFVSPDFRKIVMDTDGQSISATITDFNRARLSVLRLELIEAYDNANVFIRSMDSYAVPAVDLAIKQTAMPGILTGELTVDQAVAAVQRAAREYLAARQ